MILFCSLLPPAIVFSSSRKSRSGFGISLSGNGAKLFPRTFSNLTLSLWRWAKSWRQEQDDWNTPTSRSAERAHRQRAPCMSRDNKQANPKAAWTRDGKKIWVELNRHSLPRVVPLHRRDFEKSIEPHQSGCCLLNAKACQWHLRFTVPHACCVAIRWKRDHLSNKPLELW